MRILLSVIACGCSLTATVTAAQSGERFDLVLRNGRVIDPESQLDAVRDVGIRDGKIVSISEERLRGKREIDAKGR